MPRPMRMRPKTAFARNALKRSVWASRKTHPRPMSQAAPAGKRLTGVGAGGGVLFGVRSAVGWG